MHIIAPPLHPSLSPHLYKLFSTNTSLTSIKQLAILRHEQGRHSEAEAGLRRALAGQRSLLGRQHASTLNTQSWLEAVLVSLGRSAAAAKREAAL